MTDETQQPKEEVEKISITFSKEELYARADDLNRDEDIQLFLKVQRGMLKFDELQKLTALLNKKK